MKHIALLVICICLLLGGIFSFGIEIYSKDTFFLPIGGLLVVASILLFLEFKKIKNDPFL
jgi:uncharacterized membrane protein